MVWMPGEAGFLDGDDYLLCGFEDLNRAVRSDDDFNDCVFIVTATPIAALGNTEAQRYQGEDREFDPGAVALDPGRPDPAARDLRRGGSGRGLAV